jgi:hypothetical protein
MRALLISCADDSSWMPFISHWAVPSGSTSIVAVANLPLGVLHHFWHTDNSVICACPGPPLAVASHLLLCPSF